MRDSTGGEAARNRGRGGGGPTLPPLGKNIYEYAMGDTPSARNYCCWIPSLLCFVPRQTSMRPVCCDQSDIPTQIYYPRNVSPAVINAALCRREYYSVKIGTKKKNDVDVGVRRAQQWAGGLARFSLTASFIFELL